MRKLSSRTRSHKFSGILLWSGVLVISLFLTPWHTQAQTTGTAEFTQNKRNNHAMNLQIPLINYPGRGMSVPVNLRYSTSGLWRIGFIDSIPMGSSIWRSVTEAIYAEHSTAGWTTSLDVPRVEWPKHNDVYWYTGKAYPRGPVSPWTFRVPNLFMHLPDGSTHEMRKSDAVYADGSGNIQMTGTFYAVDGSRMRYDSTGQNTGTLFLPDGTRYVLGTSTVQCIDPDGNTLTYNISTREWTDTMNRVIGMPWPVNPGPGQYNYVLKGFDNVDQTYTFTFQSLSATLSPASQGQSLRPIGDHYLPDPNSPPTGPGGSNAPQTVSGSTHFQSVYSSPEETTQSFTYVLGRGQVTSSAFNPTVLAEIGLPNGQTYKFFYNIKGEIDKVIYPTGSYERFQHSTVASVGVATPPYTQGSRGVISRWLSANGTGTDEEQWQFSSSNSPFIATAPDLTRTETNLFSFPAGPNPENFGYRDQRHGLVKEVRVYGPGAQGALLRRILYEYAQSSATIAKPVPPNTNNSGSYTAHRNVRLVKQVTLILDTGADALAKIQTFEYAQANQSGFEFTTGWDRTASTETHFQAVPQPTALTGVIADFQPEDNTAVRVETLYLNDSAYQNRDILGIAESVVFKGKINGSLQAVARTEFEYDEPAYPLLTYGDLESPGYIDPGTTVRGNVTTTRRFVDAAATISIETHAQFDQCGNVRKAMNERGMITETEYAATYKHAFATKTISPVPGHGSNVAFETSSTFDATTGLAVSATDANGQVTSFHYRNDQNVIDPLNRLRKVTRPDGGWTKYSFGESVGNLFKLTETQQDATRTSKSYEYLDPAGRISRTFSSEIGNDYLATDTIYDKMGRPWKVSSPYRTSTLNGVADLSHTSHWTISTYDPLGRIATVTLPDSSVVQTSYQGEYTTFTDQAGKLRRHKSDAFGRIERVDEPNASGSLGPVDAPVQPTLYEYDAQGNLVHVQQGTTQVQHRYFKYDALSRLTHERQVEQAATFSVFDPVTGNSSWSRHLVYDETVQTETYTGLLTTVHDARSINTKFRYDQLNRLDEVSYSDGTPTLTNKYDQARGDYFNKGRLTESLTAATADRPATGQLYDFDRMGRVVHHEQTVGSQTYVMEYSYNLGGALTSQKYPSGRIMSYTFDDAARLSQVSSGTKVYANQFDYTSPSGLLKSLTLGNTAVESYVYNSRLQLQSLELTKSGAQHQRYEYKYGVYDPVANTLDETKNSGEIAQIEGFIQTQKQWRQRFAYDSIGRLSSAREFPGDSIQPSYLVNYEYDVFGNRYQKQAQNGANPFSQVWVETSHVDLATNRFNTGVTYDLAGNVTVDSKFRNRRFEYDANNRQKQSRNLDDSGSVDSVFDAGGQRVATQVSGSLTTVLVYDVMGKLVAEYNSTPAMGGTQYILSDHQSTPRTITNQQGTVIARNDYLPFGEDVPNNVGLRTPGQGYGVTAAARQKYAGMESNPATGLAHTLWRQYDSLSGRWTAPDPYRASLSIENPQSLNRYSYVDNDPVNQVDPDGLMGQVADASMGWGAVSGGFWGDSLDIGIRPQNHIAEAEARIDSINLTGWDPAFGVYRYIDWYVRGHGEHSGAISPGDPRPEDVEGNVGTSEDPLSQRGGGGRRRGGGGGRGGDPKRDPSNYVYRGRGRYEYVGPGSWAHGAGKPPAPPPGPVGYSSFPAFKRAMGPLPPLVSGWHWHHIVAQHEINVSRFGANRIHNTRNLVLISPRVHYRISGYYSSKQDFTGGERVRDWVRTHSYEFQHQFGMKVLRKAIQDEARGY